MIPSIDTYLYDAIEEKLKIILSNRYIIEEILKGVQPSVAKNFMRAYTGETGRDIPIVYTMPQEKVTQQGSIYIGLREGQETDPSIGNIESTYEFKEGGLRREDVFIQATPELDRCFLEVEYPIGELNNVENIQFAASDNKTVEENRIYFKYDPDLVGTGPFVVNYSILNGEEQGLRKGFTTTEYYSVLAISTNMDTVRCIDLILKAIFILMRNSKEELNYFLLQKIQFGQIQEINTGDENPEILYGRESVVSYKVSYSLDAPLYQTLEEIMVSIKEK